MLTRSEKTYLAMILVFLAAGGGLKAWRRATVHLGPFADTATLAQDSAQAPDSSARAAADPPAIADTAATVSDVSHPSRKASPDGSGFSGKIDLNRADAAGLMRIKGVGEKTAEAILAFRRAHGPFRNVRDLLQIKGIGEKKLEKLSPHIIL